MCDACHRRLRVEHVARAQTDEKKQRKEKEVFTRLSPSLSAAQIKAMLPRVSLCERRPQVRWKTMNTTLALKSVQTGQHL